MYLHVISFLTNFRIYGSLLFHYQHIGKQKTFALLILLLVVLTLKIYLIYLLMIFIISKHFLFLK